MNKYLPIYIRTKARRRIHKSMQDNYTRAYKIQSERWDKVLIDKLFEYNT